MRGMRHSLLNDINKAWLLDLHGNSKRKEISPLPEPDRNVFDIQQGVAISLLVKKSATVLDPQVFWGELWGTRDRKYADLLSSDCYQISRLEVNPSSPIYLFVPQDDTLKSEFESGVSLSEMFPLYSTGIATARDSMTVRFRRAEIEEIISDFSTLDIARLREKYDLRRDTNDWKVGLAKEDVLRNSADPQLISPISYRPFDQRFTYYTGQARGFLCNPRKPVMTNMLSGPNLALCTSKSVETGTGFSHVFCSAGLLDHHSVSIKEVNYAFPLYEYPSGTLFDNELGKRQSNLTPEFVGKLAQILDLRFVQEDRGDLDETFGPEDVFHYAYAIFHSPTYRERYAEFLKRDFPRLPLTTDLDLFSELCQWGDKLLSPLAQL